MNDVFSIETSFPPSLAESPVVAMLTVMASLAISLILMQWLYEIVDGSRDRPAAPGSAIRIARRVRVWMVSAILTMVMPRMIALMLWQLMSATVRTYAMVASWMVVIPATGMVAYAWWWDRSLAKIEASYVGGRGYTLPVAMAGAEKTRALLILGLIFVMAFAITFVRPMPHVDAHSTAVIVIR